MNRDTEVFHQTSILLVWMMDYISRGCHQQRLAQTQGAVDRRQKCPLPLDPPLRSCRGNPSKGVRRQAKNHGGQGTLHQDGKGSPTRMVMQVWPHQLVVDARMPPMRQRPHGQSDSHAQPPSRTQWGADWPRHASAAHRCGTRWLDGGSHGCQYRWAGECSSPMAKLGPSGAETSSCSIDGSKSERQQHASATLEHTFTAMALRRRHGSGLQRSSSTSSSATATATAAANARRRRNKQRGYRGTRRGGQPQAQHLELRKHDDWQEARCSCLGQIASNRGRAQDATQRAGGTAQRAREEAAPCDTHPASRPDGGGAAIHHARCNRNPPCNSSTTRAGAARRADGPWGITAEHACHSAKPGRQCGRQWIAISHSSSPSDRVSCLWASTSTCQRSSRQCGSCGTASDAGNASNTSGDYTQEAQEQGSAGLQEQEAQAVSSMKQEWRHHMSMSAPAADLPTSSMLQAFDSCRTIDKGDLRTLEGGARGSRNEVSAYGSVRDCCKVNDRYACIDSRNAHIVSARARDARCCCACAQCIHASASRAHPDHGMCAQRIGEASNPGPKNKKPAHPLWPSFMITFLDEADPIALHLARIESRGLWRWQSAGKRRRASSDRGTPQAALQHWLETYREEINEESILHIRQCLRQATSDSTPSAPHGGEPRLRITGKQSLAQTANAGVLKQDNPTLPLSEEVAESCSLPPPAEEPMHAPPWQIPSCDEVAMIAQRTLEQCVANPVRTQIAPPKSTRHVVHEALRWLVVLQEEHEGSQLAQVARIMFMLAPRLLWPMPAKPSKGRQEPYARVQVVQRRLDLATGKMASATRHGRRELRS